jgi:hypothetical protein
VSLSAWEERSLGRIAAGLSGSDPRLASLLDGFNRVVSGEAMPVEDGVVRVRRGPRRRVRYRPAHGRPLVPRARFPARAVIAAWIVTTVVLIVVVLTVVHPGGHGGTGPATGNAGKCRAVLAGVCGSVGGGRYPGLP